MILLAISKMPIKFHWGHCFCWLCSLVFLFPIELEGQVTCGSHNLTCVRWKWKKDWNQAFFERKNQTLNSLQTGTDFCFCWGTDSYGNISESRGFKPSVPAGDEDILRHVLSCKKCGSLPEKWFWWRSMSWLEKVPPWCSFRQKCLQTSKFESGPQGSTFQVWVLPVLIPRLCTHTGIPFSHPVLSLCILQGCVRPLQINDLKKHLSIFWTWMESNIYSNTTGGSTNGQQSTKVTKSQKPSNTVQVHNDKHYTPTVKPCTVQQMVLGEGGGCLFGLHEYVTSEQCQKDILATTSFAFSINGDCCHKYSASTQWQTLHPQNAVDQKLEQLIITETGKYTDTITDS